MSKVLVIAEHDGETLNLSTSKTVACALTLEPEAIDVAVFADAGNKPAQAAARLNGVTRVLLVEHVANQNPVAAVLAPQISALARDYTHVLAPATTFGKDVLPRAAALLGVPQVSDVMRVIDRNVFERPIYAGNAVETVETPPGIVVATVRTASFKAVPESGSAPVEKISLDFDCPTHTRFLRVESSSGGRPDLQSARVVVSGGRGLGTKENFDLIYALADRLGAAVGASRAAVDAGLVPNDLQVGQTGKIIAPEFYLAFGISGAIQHLAGIKDAGTIVAVNKDPDAPIFEVADIGLVADLFDVLPALIEALSKGRA
ncbi:electron transfer flavoprotein subunit alpha/FixB family protein [Methylocaldum szegediense]|uniref:Electron transfer flavoprotein subunit alpha n=1 Tax=Methylocaldum szegediense TaxID=73780 RepID=A0ABN8WZH2_9GAMM|nr:FAD-binding protein [Methylocaldum szegediense]CAI8778741.1 Electron transfer flavoprotein subunit alpha [Methylocaldum szegediense]